MSINLSSLGLFPFRFFNWFVHIREEGLSTHETLQHFWYLNTIFPLVILKDAAHGSLCRCEGRVQQVHILFGLLVTLQEYAQLGVKIQIFAKYQNYAKVL